MPEGHTVHRLAARVRSHLGGRVLEVGSPQGRFAAGAALLDGQRLARTDAVGKHLLVGFVPEGAPPRRAPGQWLHVHLGLYGKWAFGEDEVPEVRGQVRARLVTLDEGPLRWAELRGPTACEVVTTAEVDALRARLGPDPLRRADVPDAMLARVAATRTSIGALLMHQDVVAGAGNIYRAEVLFRAGVAPSTPGRDVPPERVEAMWDDLRVLMADGVRKGRIVTTERADRRRGTAGGTGRGREGDHYVYRRAGLPCRVCGTPVATSVVEGRNLFWCPVCQAPGADPPVLGEREPEAA